MIEYRRELTVPWGESDPFGLVYFPRMLSWFNDTEHDLLRSLGHGTEAMIERDRTAFVMGQINFRFIGPAAYGDRIETTIKVEKVTNSTVQWGCAAKRIPSGEPVTEGTATRIYAQIQADGTLKSAVIPDDIRRALTEGGEVSGAS